MISSGKPDNDEREKMKIGDVVTVREPGAFFGEKGVIFQLPKTEIKTSGFDLSVPSEHQTVTVKIFGGVLGIFVKSSDLEF